MKKFMLTTSAITLFAFAPAMAQNAQVDTSVEAKAESNWSETKEAASEAWDSTKEAANETADAIASGAKKAYQETAAWLDTNTDIDGYTDNEMRISASDVSGMDIFDTQDKKIGNVSDLVINKDGDIEQIVVKNGGLFGIGGEKHVIDYDNVTLQTDGKVGLSTEMTMAELNAGTNFEASALNENMFLASNLANAPVVNAAMEQVGEVDNVVFENGEIAKMVVSYDNANNNNVRGLVDFADTKIVTNAEGETSFQISE